MLGDLALKWSSSVNLASRGEIRIGICFIFLRHMKSEDVLIGSNLMTGKG